MLFLLFMQPQLQSLSMLNLLMLQHLPQRLCPSPCSSIQTCPSLWWTWANLSPCLWLWIWSPGRWIPWICSVCSQWKPQWIQHSWRIPCCSSWWPHPDCLIPCWQCWVWLCCWCQIWGCCYPIWSSQASLCSSPCTSLCPNCLDVWCHYNLLNLIYQIKMMNLIFLVLFLVKSCWVWLDRFEEGVTIPYKVSELAFAPALLKLQLPHPIWTM